MTVETTRFVRRRVVRFERFFLVELNGIVRLAILVVSAPLPAVASSDGLIRRGNLNLRRRRDRIDAIDGSHRRSGDLWRRPLFAQIGAQAHHGLGVELVNP